MGLYLPPASTLLYGPAGAGKTPLAVSSFWDWQNEKLIAKGKYISFGAEDNPALGIPEECRHTENGTSLTLTSPMLDDRAFLEQFDLITRKIVYDAEHGDYLDALVLDGVSEFDLLYEYTFGADSDADESENRFAKWDGLMTEVFSMLTRIHPRIINCAVFVTARVMEKKKASRSKNATAAGDPGWQNFDYYPSMRGSFRYHLPNYFNNVFYLDTEPIYDAANNVIPGHAVHVLTKGEYLTKCQWEHKWLKAGLATPQYNVMWPELWAMLTGTPTAQNDNGGN